MDPRIQYAQTADGVSIAFWTLGEGEPFVYTQAPFSHIQLEWQNRDVRRWYERLAEKRKLVRYDGREPTVSCAHKSLTICVAQQTGIMVPPHLT